MKIQLQNIETYAMLQLANAFLSVKCLLQVQEIFHFQIFVKKISMSKEFSFLQLGKMKEVPTENKTKTNDLSKNIVHVLTLGILVKTFWERNEMTKNKKIKKREILPSKCQSLLCCEIKEETCIGIYSEF